jgi:hypothetical protein
VVPKQVDQVVDSLSCIPGTAGFIPRGVKGCLKGMN